MRITGIALSPPDPTPPASYSTTSSAEQYESFSASNGSYRNNNFNVNIRNGSSSGINSNNHWSLWATTVGCTEGGQAAGGEAGGPGSSAGGAGGVGSSSGAGRSGGGMMSRSTNGRDRFHQSASPSAGSAVGASCSGVFLRCGLRGCVVGVVYGVV